MTTKDQNETERVPDRVDHIASQYAELYDWSDRDAIRLYFRIEALAESLQQASRRLVSSLLPGFKGWQGAILRALYVSDERRLTLEALLGETMVSDSEIHRQLDVLVEDGLVAVAPDAAESGSTSAVLTTEGAAICAALLPARARFMTELSSTLHNDEKILLNDWLERLQRNAEASSQM
jgi:DNA-binding MarR family transcriptional regulator